MIYTNTNVSNINISDNCLLATTFTPSHHLYLEYIHESVVSSNIIIGTGHVGHGINLAYAPNKMVIHGNVVSGTNIGITAYGDESIVNGNTINDCILGIYVGNEGVTVTNNAIQGCTTGLNNNTTYAFVANNHIKGNSTNITGTRVMYGQIQTNPKTTRSWKVDTLVGGTKIVTIYHVKEGDAFIVAPITINDNVNNGALYVGNIDPTNSQVTVTSTNANDDRTFLLLKISSETP